jgi:hypothetical protein
MFPKLQRMLKGTGFSDVEDIKSFVKKYDIPVQNFKKLFSTMAEALGIL